jgi:hypothetical protein
MDRKKINIKQYADSLGIKPSDLSKSLDIPKEELKKVLDNNLSDEDRDKILKPYIAMGHSYATKGNFITPEARKFTGPETFPWLIRKLIMLVFRFFENKVFEKAAKEWGCTQPLDYKPY